MNICFPRLYVPGNTSLDKKLYETFVNDVLLVALRASVHISISNRFPNSYQHCMDLQRTPKGEHDFVPSPIPPCAIQRLANNMRQIIDDSRDLSRAFGGFFFLTHGHGLKSPIQTLSDMPATFPELDMAIVGQDRKCFVDLAMEKFGPTSTPSTTIWKGSNTGGDIRHSSLLAPFFPGRYLQKSRYRLDPFMNFSQLAGFNYTSSSIAVPSSTGIFAIKGYPTFKHPFYHRVIDSDRHTKSISGESILDNDSKLSFYKV